MSRISTISAVVLAVTCGASLAQASGIQTIDCNDDLNAAEQTICDSQRLQILDAKITERYADLMLGRLLTDTGRNVLRRHQYAFLARRDACGRDDFCITSAMTERLRSLRVTY